MLKIELSNLQFHGFHGIHEEESKTGGNFEVDLVIYFDPGVTPVRHLNETIDYTKLYELVRKRMEKPTRLLETLATEIAQEVLSAYSKIQEVSVNVKKLNAPIPFFNGKISVEHTLKRS
jgi:dihydroneopterin aldolase